MTCPQNPSCWTPTCRWAWSSSKPVYKNFWKKPNSKKIPHFVRWEQLYIVSCSGFFCSLLPKPLTRLGSAPALNKWYLDPVPFSGQTDMKKSVEHPSKQFSFSKTVWVQTKFFYKTNSLGAFEMPSCATREWPRSAAKWKHVVPASSLVLGSAFQGSRVWKQRNGHMPNVWTPWILFKHFGSFSKDVCFHPPRNTSCVLELGETESSK